jgi:signal transduction histidine kinase/PAS domain-containing protein
METKAKTNEALMQKLQDLNQENLSLKQSLNNKINELMQADEARRKLQSSLVRSQRMAKIGSWTFDPISLDIDWSEEMYAMHRLDPFVHPICIKHGKKLIYPDDRQRFETLVQLALSDSSPFKIELRGMRMDGTSFHQVTCGEIEVLEDGSHILAGTTQDITELKQLEDKKNELLEFEKLISEIASSFVLIQTQQLSQIISEAQRLICEFLNLDLSSIYQPVSESGDQLKLTYIYDRYGKIVLPELLKASEYFPWCEKELLSGNIPVVNSMNNLPSEAARDRKSWEYFGIKSSVMIPMIAAKDEFLGTISFDAIQAEYYFSDELINRLKLVATIFANLIRRSRKEIQLLESKEKAEESDRLKSAFLANMSHEIRTPMNGILGFAELLKEPELTGEEQQKYIRMIETGGIRLLNIINNLISISQVEAGQMEINISVTNIDEQIDFIYNFFKPEAERLMIQLIPKINPRLNGTIVRTDKEKVYAVLTNLITNAIKYTRKGSIEFGYEKTDSCLEFFVKDTGIGIPADRQEAIFERFIKADHYNKQAMQGAGLGLSISKAFVEILGGKIRLESEIEKGSTFYFTIPYTD